MLHIKKILTAACIVSCLASNSQGQDTPAGPLYRLGTELAKSDFIASEALKKIAVEINDLKARLLVVEESHSRNHTVAKAQLQTMQDQLKMMSVNFERLQNEFVAIKTATTSGLSQASLVVPAAKKPIEDGIANKSELTAQDYTNKRLDEISAALQDLAKLKNEIQNNSRDTLDLKKKYDALQLDFIQAQNDIGKLQQEMVRMNTRVDGYRAQSESNATDRTRQSLSLPVPPDSQANAAAPRSNLGTLRLVNQYPMTLTTIVDGQFYTLQPNQSLSLNRAPGYVTYEVVGVQGNTLRTINPAETLTVQIVPR